MNKTTLLKSLLNLKNAISNNEIIKEIYVQKTPGTRSTYAVHAITLRKGVYKNYYSLNDWDSSPFNYATGFNSLTQAKKMLLKHRKFSRMVSL